MNEITLNTTGTQSSIYFGHSPEHEMARETEIQSI